MQKQMRNAPRTISKRVLQSLFAPSAREDGLPDCRLCLDVHHHVLEPPGGVDAPLLRLDSGLLLGQKQLRPLYQPPERAGNLGCIGEPVRIWRVRSRSQAADGLPVVEAGARAAYC